MSGTRLYSSNTHTRCVPRDGKPVDLMVAQSVTTLETTRRSNGAFIVHYSAIAEILMMHILIVQRNSKTMLR